MNQVTLLGRLTKNPDLKVTTNGKKYLSFSIAINEKWKNGEQHTTFVNCIAWEGKAEAIAHWFVKGKPILLWGKLVVDKVQNDDGTKVTYTTVNVSNFEFVPRDNTVEGDTVATTIEEDGFTKNEFGEGWVQTEDNDIPF